MRVKITRTITGAWRGIELPPRGRVVDVDTDTGAALVNDGLGVPVADGDDVETATKPTESVESRPARSGLSKASMRGDDETQSQGPASEPDAATVRTWATEQGFDVPARGRLPQALYDAYTAAHEGSGDSASDGES